MLICLHLPAIASDKKRTERELLVEYEQHQTAIALIGLILSP